MSEHNPNCGPDCGHDHGADEGDREVLLVVALAGEHLEVEHNMAKFEDPADWGEVFAMLAHTVAGVLKEQDGTDPAEVVARIREAFLVELDNPTTGPAPTPTESPS